MNQLFYNIAGGIVHQIRREKRTTISEISSKIEIGFISIFLLKARVLNFTILKQKKFKITFKGWNRPDCLLLGFTRVSFWQNLLHFTLGQWSESWRRWCRALFRCFSLFLPHLRTQAREKWSQNCLLFGTGGPSLCLYPLLPRNIIFCPVLTMAARAKKKSGEAICSRHQRALSRFWAVLCTLNLIACLC